MFSNMKTLRLGLTISASLLASAAFHPAHAEWGDMVFNQQVVGNISTALTSCAYRNADSLVDHYIGPNQAQLRMGSANPCWQFYEEIAAVDGAEPAAGIFKAIEGSVISQCRSDHPSELCGRGWDSEHGLLPRKIAETAPPPSRTWVAVLLVYSAPSNAVNWHGPWAKGMTIAGRNFYPSEASCEADTEAWIARVHQGMKVPTKFRCVPFPETLN